MYGDPRRHALYLRSLAGGDNETNLLPFHAVHV